MVATMTAPETALLGDPAVYPDRTVYVVLHKGVRLWVRDLTTRYEVKGADSDDTHTVTARGDRMACDCKGHHYRGRCRHSAAVRAVRAAW